MRKYSILCVDDDKLIVEALGLILENAGYTVHTAQNGSDALEICENEAIDIAIVDYKMPGMDGIDLLKMIKERKNSIEVLILTGHGTVPTAVDPIQPGAFDYILKPFHKNDLLNRVNKALSLKKLQKENLQLKLSLKEKYQLTNLIGSTPKMIKIFTMIPRIADSDSTVLVQGETGTGKEEIAKAVHYCGNRSDKLFNIVDCAAINPNLIESELFGHVKGAFTGAINDKTGLLKAAGDGTLFLDEIAEIPVYIQVKLLRAIEERVIRPVGSIQPVHFEARIITATSRNLQEAIKKKEFREDLYFRLNVVTINIPPLRDRRDDIPLLVHHFIQKFDDGRNIISDVSKDAMDIFMNYSWPGNIRQLENCIERAFSLGVKGKIGIYDLPDSIVSGDHRRPLPNVHEASSLSDYEKDIIVKTINAANGNKREAAKKLNIGVTTLYRKLKKYGLEL